MDEFDRRYFDPATAKYVELNSDIIKMTTLFFHAEARLYFAKSPDFVAEALKDINPNADAIVLKCPFEDRGRLLVFHEAFGLLDGKAVFPRGCFDLNTARKKFVCTSPDPVTDVHYRAQRWIDVRSVVVHIEP